MGRVTAPSTPQRVSVPHGPPEARPGGAVHPVVRAMTTVTVQTVSAVTENRRMVEAGNATAVALPVRAQAPAGE